MAKSKSLVSTPGPVNKPTTPSPSTKRKSPTFHLKSAKIISLEKYNKAQKNNYLKLSLSVWLYLTQPPSHNPTLFTRRISNSTMKNYKVDWNNCKNQTILNFWFWSFKACVKSTANSDPKPDKSSVGFNLTNSQSLIYSNSILTTFLRNSKS